MRNVKNGSSDLAGRNERTGGLLTRLTLVALCDFAGARFTLVAFLAADDLAAVFVLLAGFFAAGM